MKTIEQAAKDFIWESGETHPQSCFEAGAKWMQEWIPAEIPPDGKQDIPY
jgi:hypothetical protein